MRLRGGVDLGGTKILALVVDEEHEIRGQARRPTPTEGGPRDVAEAIGDTLEEAAREAGVEPGALAGLGVGSPGTVDRAKGTVTSARNLPSWEESFPLGPVLAERFGLEVTLGNDVGTAILAESEIGAGRPYDSLLGVWWGTGTGGGVVLGGELWRGRGGAGEIGHVVVKRGGARCPCGRRGCMEAYAGRLAMERRARALVEEGERTKLFKLMDKHGRPRLTSGIWARALEQEDPMAVQLVDRAIEALGAGVASAVNLLDVEAVILGGGMGERLGEPYHDRLLAAMHPHLFRDDTPPALRVTELPGVGGGLGAAMLVSG